MPAGAVESGANSLNPSLEIASGSRTSGMKWPHCPATSDRVIMLSK